MITASRNFKIMFLLLSLICPIAFGFIGAFFWRITGGSSLLSLFVVLGFASGILLNIICLRKRLFTLALFHIPIPFSFFLLTWWIADIFTSIISAIFIGVIGFLIGIWINYELVLPYQFYKIKKRILASVYVVFSVAVWGIFMGIPFFNILLGVLAGNYLSIRVMENYRREAFVLKNFRQGALFTSAVLFVLLIISALTSLDVFPSLIREIEKVLYITLNPILHPWLIAILGIIVLLLQYFITIFTAKTMFAYWMSKKQKSQTKNSKDDY